MSNSRGIRGRKTLERMYGKLLMRRRARRRPAGGSLAGKVFASYGVISVVTLSSGCAES
jgi:hypothetical protein